LAIRATLPAAVAFIKPVLRSRDYADEVRAEEGEYQAMGIQPCRRSSLTIAIWRLTDNPWKPSSKLSNRPWPKRSVASSPAQWFAKTVLPAHGILTGARLSWM